METTVFKAHNPNTKRMSHKTTMSKGIGIR